MQDAATQRCVSQASCCHVNIMSTYSVPCPNFGSMKDGVIWTFPYTTCYNKFDREPHFVVWPGSSGRVAHILQEKLCVYVCSLLFNKSHRNVWRWMLTAFVRLKFLERVRAHSLFGPLNPNFKTVSVTPAWTCSFFPILWELFGDELENWMTLFQTLSMV